MINVSAKIGSGQIGYIDLPQETNNISNPNIVNNIYRSKNNFILGVTKLYEKASPTDEVNYFIGNVLSDENGNFNTPYYISITGFSASFVIIYFDVYNNLHPRQVEVIYSGGAAENLILTSSAIVIPFKYSGTINIVIDNWNKSNSPLIISGIMSEYEINHFISLDLENQDRSDTEFPSWQVKSNSGRAKFVDKYKIVEQIIKFQDHNKTTVMDLYLNYLTTSKKIASYYTDSQETDRKTLECNLELKDEVYYWQNKKSKTYYLHDFITVMNTFELLTLVCEDNQIDIVCDKSTENHLKNIRVKFPKLDGGSVWSQITKICELTACYVSCNSDGKPEIRYDGGR